MHFQSSHLFLFFVIICGCIHFGSAGGLFSSDMMMANPYGNNQVEMEEYSSFDASPLHQHPGVHYRRSKSGPPPVKVLNCTKSLCAQLHSGHTKDYVVTLPLLSNVSNIQSFPFQVPYNGLRTSNPTVSLTFIYIQCEGDACLDTPSSMNINLTVRSGAHPLILNASITGPSVNQFTFKAKVSTPYQLTLVYPIPAAPNQITLTYQMVMTWPTGSPGWVIFLIVVGGFCILLISGILAIQLKKEFDIRNMSKGYTVLV